MQVELELEPASVAPLELSRCTAKFVPVGPQVENARAPLPSTGKLNVVLAPLLLIEPLTSQVTGAPLTFQAER